MHSERRESILDLLKHSSSLSVKKIAEGLNVSEMTVRRDLEKLEEEGIVQRSFGGATLVEGLFIEKATPLRAKNMPDAKRKIAMLANSLISDGDAVILEGGTTIYELSKLVSKKIITIITSSLQIAMNSGKGKAQVYITGGKLDYSYFKLSGVSAEQFYRNVNCKWAFVSAGGVSVKSGVSEYTQHDAALKKVILEQAEKKVLLADQSKFNKGMLFRSADIADFDIVITDEEPSKEYVDYMMDNNVKLLIPNKK